MRIGKALAGSQFTLAGEEEKEDDFTQCACAQEETPEFLAKSQRRQERKKGLPFAPFATLRLGEKRCSRLWRRSAVRTEQAIANRKEHVVVAGCAFVVGEMVLSHPFKLPGKLAEVDAPVNLLIKDVVENEADHHSCADARSEPIQEGEREAVYQQQNDDAERRAGEADVQRFVGAPETLVVHPMHITEASDSTVEESPVIDILKGVRIEDGDKKAREPVAPAEQAAPKKAPADEQRRRKQMMMQSPANGYGLRFGKDRVRHWYPLY